MKTLGGATDKTADNTVLKALHDASLATKYLPDNVKGWASIINFVNGLVFYEETIEVISLLTTSPNLQ